MNRLSSKLKSLQHFAAEMLLVVMVFQFGACPCGCIEHNAWMQLIGFDAVDGEQHLAVSYSDSDKILFASVSDVHDCTGDPIPQFVENSRPPSLQRTVSVELFPTATPGTLMLTFANGLVKDSLSDPARLPFHAALSRPALQVFRL